jgi:ATP-dependent helicase HepA
MQRFFVQDFIPGQRWVSSAELSLGLGTVLSVEQRTVTLVFPASGETRTYARQTAPLSRVRFVPGDSILAAEDLNLSVESVSEKDGLLTYRASDPQGRTRDIEEQLLNPFIQLNRPGERLFSYQIDSNRLFEIRQRSWMHRSRLARSDLYGLTGCRTSLIPHQLYIAHEVAGRYAPRVLLADEVGLGKTIEAGLILHQQLLTERARRVLIVVPENLLHQWLVEMLRRFNLMFSVFDEARCQAVEDSGLAENPFHSEQLVLCSLNFLAASPRGHQALDGNWDLLVVDEAHHLQWSPQQASHEYQLIAQLAAGTPGVLLLTATPEQLGRTSHFARLRLLDPHRFPDLDSFIREEESYQPVAEAVEHLLDDAPLGRQQREAMKRILLDTDTDTLLDALQCPPTGSGAHGTARQTLVNRLMDRHGTGRILFRNTRSAVHGFPRRKLNSYPLSLPPAYTDCLAQLAADSDSVTRLPWPERAYADSGQTPAWTDFDPRVAWLSATLAALKSRKVLVIAAHAQTAIELADALYQRCGIHAALFHEQLSLVERDRAAAFFADCDRGTQVLICSEIGSEGRNFQFAHHLVLFDLPLNPDLLEQRIGRLDRIGQTQTIQIHVPYLENSAQAVLYHWYHYGLGAFEHTCPAGPQICTTQLAQLHALLRDPGAALTGLIEQAAGLNAELNRALQRGRDRLLEYNSCRQPAADQLCLQAQQMEDAALLADYMDELLDAFGVDCQPHSEGCQIARPGEHMLHPLPGLPDDGLTITYDRDVALAFEDTQYCSWEHPLVRNTMDMLLSSELGNCAVCAVKYPGARPGTLLLECLYILEGSHHELVRWHHLPATPIRVVIDEQGRGHEENLTVELVAARAVTLNSQTAQQVVQAREQLLRTLLQECDRQAAARAPLITATSSRQAHRALQLEIDRLRALSRVNATVRPEEIEFLEYQRQLLDSVLHAVNPRLDALRVMVAT